MKVSKLLLSALAIGTISIATLSAPAYAWHPVGKISKKVQNVTTGSTLVEADDKNSAVAAKPGDMLKYVIEVRNDGTADDRGYNDMANIVMKDTLPSGIELSGKPSQRQITENYDLIKPGKKMTWEYLVKVTATQEGNIENTACFTGNSTINDSAQSGCNPAFVTVTIPPKPQEPPVPVTPTTPKTPETPVELPKTGLAENVLGSTIALGAASYAIYRYIASRRALKNNTLA